MGQFVGCVEGMAEACRALDFPVVSGNVSLYNETKNEDGPSLAILPTPAIGSVGLLEDWEKSATIAFKGENHHLWLIGGNGSRGSHLGQSLWLREVGGSEDGPSPTVNLPTEQRAGALVRQAIEQGWANAVHDCSDGGLLIAIAEMALAAGIGASVEITWADCAPLNAQMFGEDQSRYVVAVADPEDYRLIERAKELGVPWMWAGVTGGDYIGIADDSQRVSLADLRAAHEGFFPKLMGSELTPEF
jgi:phosphoribosylformylglycinamidine synthase